MCRDVQNDSFTVSSARSSIVPVVSMVCGLWHWHLNSLSWKASWMPQWNSRKKMLMASQIHDSYGKMIRIQHMVPNLWSLIVSHCGWTSAYDLKARRYKKTFSLSLSQTFLPGFHVKIVTSIPQEASSSGCVGSVCNYIWICTYSTYIYILYLYLQWFRKT